MVKFIVAAFCVLLDEFQLLVVQLILILQIFQINHVVFSTSPSGAEHPVIVTVVKYPVAICT